MLTPELKNQFRYKLRFKKRQPKPTFHHRQPSPSPPPPPSPLRPQPDHVQITLNDIPKSQQDPKAYRSLILANALKVTLISDATASKSAACMSIEVGHMSDPPDTPGLAHLCEHALFLGSAKFPTANDFRLFLSENGGTTNAQTFADVTKFFFDVVCVKFESALERFAQMFIAPLFDREAVIREISAVDSEHEKNLASDAWRLRMVNKRVAIQTHDYVKFGTGNRNTLTKEEICEELKKFHATHYTSGNLMNLAVLGRETLDELEAIVKRHFLGGVANLDAPVPRWSDKVYDDDMMMTRTLVVPVKDVRTLTMQFQTPCLLDFYDAKPDQYIIHLLGHEGRGSVLSELRRLRLCTSLNCDHVKYAKGFGFFEIKVDLTDEGANATNDIIKLIFQHLNLIRQVGVQQWIFDELQRLAEIEFRFEDDRNPLRLVSKVSSNMRHYPLKEILIGPALFTTFRPDLIAFVLDMLVPTNLRIIIVDQSNDFKCNSTEPIYGTRYGVERIRTSTTHDWMICGTNANLYLPAPNAFIASDFEFLAIDDWRRAQPKIIRDTSLVRVWHKQDSEFRKPKAIASVELRNPTVNCDPLGWNLAHIFVWMLEDELRERLYSAILAGIEWRLCVTPFGIRLFVEGFSHRLGIFLETLLAEIFRFRIELRHFDDTYASYLAELRGFENERPQQMGIYYLEQALNEQVWSNEELVAAMKVVTLCRLKTFAKEVLTQTHADCLFYGNVDEAKALELTAVVEDRLERARRSERQMIVLAQNAARERKIEDGDFHTFQIINDFHKFNCISYFIQCGLQDDKSNVTLDLIHQIIRAEFFDVLRTQEQQGYLVDCIVRRSNNTQGIKFVVESSKHPEYIEERIKRFLVTTGKMMREMSEEKFENHKNSLKAKKLQKPLTLAAQFWQYQKEIFTQQYHFNRSQVEATMLKEIKIKDISDFFDLHLTPDSLTQKVLSIHIISRETARQTRHLPSTATNRIENFADFKSILLLNPRPRVMSLRPFYSKSVNRRSKPSS